MELSPARRFRSYSCLGNRWLCVDCLTSIPSKWNLCILISSERDIANVAWVCFSESVPVGQGPDIDVVSSSARVVYAAWAGNLAVAAAKFGASALSGSTAMLTEAIHSLVDSADYSHSPKPDWHSGPVRSPTGRLRQCDSPDLSTLVSFKASSRRVA